MIVEWILCYNGPSYSLGGYLRYRLRFSYAQMDTNQRTGQWHMLSNVSCTFPSPMTLGTGHLTV